MVKAVDSCQSFSNSIGHREHHQYDEKRDLGERIEIKRSYNDTNEHFSRNSIERDPRVTPFVSFLRSVASGATNLSNTLAKLCKLGLRHNHLFCSRATIF